MADLTYLETIASQIPRMLSSTSSGLPCRSLGLRSRARVSWTEDDFAWADLENVAVINPRIYFVAAKVMHTYAL
jgi:hypothetical protein